jgi:hypothetical protein
MRKEGGLLFFIGHLNCAGRNFEVCQKFFEGDGVLGVGKRQIPLSNHICHIFFVWTWVFDA